MVHVTLIGDSNVYRNITAKAFSTKIGHPVTILQATRLQSLEISMKEVKNDTDFLVVSALSNLLCESFGANKPTDHQLKTEIEAYLNLLSTAQSRRILLVPPFLRTSPAWFGELLGEMLRNLTAMTKDNPVMLLLPEFVVKTDQLISDGVHLSPATGALFLDYLANCTIDASKATTASPPQLSDSTEIISILKGSVLPKLDELTTTQKKVIHFNRSLQTEQNVIVLNCLMYTFTSSYFNPAHL